jgi:signal transduction histidine kinase
MTGAFALAMVLVLTATAVFVYMRQRSDLDETIDNSLRSRSDDVAALLRQPGRSLAEGRERRLVESEESLVQILTPSGRLVDGMTRAQAPVLRPEEARRAARSTVVFDRRVPPIDGPARILARPVEGAGRELVVVTGVQIEDRHDALAGLLTSFVIGGPIAVLLASAMGYALASAGFAPVEAMRQRAKRISLSRNGERLPLPEAKDEIRRLGETLNEMLGRLEASLDRERRFVADAGHELRTPVTVAKTELEVALRAQDDEKVRLSVVSALEEMDHLAQLAEDLLLIARAGDGPLVVKRDVVDIGGVLERTRQRFADRAREMGRKIVVGAPSGIRASVDVLRMRQALGNLVDNSLRYGAGDIRLSARLAGGTLEIDVSDDGPGFAAEVAPRAFDRFTRGKGVRAHGGAGLGLAIVRAIAEAHGGTAMIVENGSGGATVRLRVLALAESHDRVPLLSSESQEPRAH